MATAGEVTAGKGGGGKGENAGLGKLHLATSLQGRLGKLLEHSLQFRKLS